MNVRIITINWHCILIVVVLLFLFVFLESQQQQKDCEIKSREMQDLQEPDPERGYENLVGNPTEGRSRLRRQLELLHYLFQNPTQIESQY